MDKKKWSSFLCCFLYIIYHVKDTPRELRYNPFRQKPVTTQNQGSPTVCMYCDLRVKETKPLTPFLSDTTSLHDLEKKISNLTILSQKS